MDNTTLYAIGNTLTTVRKQLADTALTTTDEKAGDKVAESIAILDVVIALIETTADTETRKEGD